MIYEGVPFVRSWISVVLGVLCLISAWIIGAFGVMYMRHGQRLRFSLALIVAITLIIAGLHLVFYLTGLVAL